MSKKREMAYEAYDKVFEEIVSLYSEGLCVAIVAGRRCRFLFFYQLFGRKAQESGDTYQADCRCSGVYCSGGFIGLSIVEQEERLTVCPGKVDGELFSRIASGSEVAVVMKLSQCEGK